MPTKESIKKARENCRKNPPKPKTKKGRKKQDRPSHSSAEKKNISKGMKKFNTCVKKKLGSKVTKGVRPAKKLKVKFTKTKEEKAKKKVVKEIKKKTKLKSKVKRKTEKKTAKKAKKKVVKEIKKAGRKKRNQVKTARKARKKVVKEIKKKTKKKVSPLLKKIERIGGRKSKNKQRTWHMRMHNDTAWVQDDEGDHEDFLRAKYWGLDNMRQITSGNMVGLEVYEFQSTDEQLIKFIHGEGASVRDYSDLWAHSIDHHSRIPDDDEYLWENL